MQRKKKATNKWKKEKETLSFLIDDFSFLVFL